MAIYTLKKVVLNWYQGEAMYTLELMASFVNATEKQASEYSSGYKNSSFRDHLGLNSDSWDLENMFQEYFPSLQRRSAFLTLWGILEHELDGLCLFYQSEKSFRLSFIDLNGKGIDRSTDYLEKVAGLQGLKASPEWYVLKRLQSIRNVVAHDGGMLRDHSGKHKNRLLAEMEKIGFLGGSTEIVMEEGFLSKVVDACHRYFELIRKAILAGHGSAY